MTKEAIVDRINALKKQKNAIILSHYYTRPEVQDIADFLGDSLALSKMAADTDADIIVFCGVHFMAETAALISPQKKVLSPAPDAGCSLADSQRGEELRKWKEQNPDGLVVSYVNTTADVKAYTDYCCTSANALRVIKALPQGKKILFGPDRNLGSYLRSMTGREMELWNGCCHVHDVIDTQMVLRALQQYPQADILIHPEALCSEDPQLLCNSRVFFYSTSGILKHARESEKDTFVIGTEAGTLHQLQKENPSKRFILISDSLICSDMKKITLESVLECLEDETGIVSLDTNLRNRAIVSINRMMEI